jgi:hypothetical protein
MTPAELLAELDRLGVTLTLTPTALRYHPRSAMTPHLLSALIQHKAAVRDALLQRQADALLAHCDGTLAWARRWADLHDRWSIPCYGFPTWSAWFADLAAQADHPHSCQTRPAV